MEDPQSSFVLESLITDIKVELGFSDLLNCEVLENNALVIESGMAKGSPQLSTVAKHEVADRQQSVSSEQQLGNGKHVEDRSLQECSGETCFTCDYCFKTFGLLTTLRRHIKRQHLVEPSKYRPHVQLSSIAKYTLRGELNCELCCKQFTSKLRLASHMGLCTGEKAYQCEICEKQFLWKSRFTAHVKYYSGEKPYQCSICDKRFLWEHSLTRHEIRHSREKLYQCSVCDKHFSCKRSLVTHMKYHSGETLYQCSICNKQFAREGGLKTHMISHSGERPYRCTICNVKFGDKDSWHRHFKIHAAEKNNKSEADYLFECEKCKRKFAGKHYNGHITKVHTEGAAFRCTVCCKIFFGQKELTEHEKVHGEKTYTCDLCGRRFALAKPFKTHMRVHSGLKKCEDLLVSMKAEDPLALNLPESTVGKKTEQFLPDPLKLEA